MTLEKQDSKIKLFLKSDFITGALGTICACFFSNPPEVIKTRLQLQGELAKSQTKIYKNPFQGRYFLVQFYPFP